MGDDSAVGICVRMTIANHAGASVSVDMRSYTEEAGGNSCNRSSTSIPESKRHLKNMPIVEKPFFVSL